MDLTRSTGGSARRGDREGELVAAGEILRGDVGPEAGVDLWNPEEARADEELGRGLEGIVIHVQRESPAKPGEAGHAKGEGGLRAGHAGLGLGEQIIDDRARRRVGY